MKRKFSMFLNIAMLCLCVCAIAFGVYSAKQASLSITGSIGFSAHNCDVDISGYIYGHATNKDGTPVAEPTKDSEKNYLTYGASNTKATERAPLAISGTTGELKFGDVFFTDMTDSGEVEPIIIKLTITNKSQFDVLLDNQTTASEEASYTAVCSNPLHVLYIATDDEKTTTLQYILRPAKVDGEYQNITTPVNISLSMKFSKFDTPMMGKESDGWLIDEDNVLYEVPEADSSGLLVISTKIETSGGIKDVLELYLGTDEGYNRLEGYTKVVVPRNITYISVEAFMYCSSLTSIAIPNSVASIGRYAFDCCSSLTSITIQKGVTSIGDSVFNHCSSLTSIVVESGNTTYDSRDNCNAIIETDTKTLIAGCSSTVIPNTVTSIGDYAFYGSGLTSITIPSSVENMGYCAFSGCSNLNTITISEGVTSIGRRAFSYCTSLTSITIPESVTSIGEEAFGHCSSLTSITIPSSVTSIGSYAFIGCTNLTSVTFENTNGWYVGYSAGAKTTAIDPSDLANTSTAATYLTNTNGGYLDKYWTRV